MWGLRSRSTFFVYSSVAGAVAWAGLASNTVFLLTAAQLIAPYAAPALTAAYASARGDGTLLARSIGRYLASLAVSAVVAAVLTFITGLDLVTELMLQVADVSAAAIVLPIAAGVAGAFAFSQADRTTIAPGAAIGMLVAVALAPQAALLGMAAVLGEPRVLASSALVAGLQLVGINTAAEAAATAALDELPGAVAVEATARFPLEGDPEVLAIQIVAVQLDRGADEAAVADAVLEHLEASVPGVAPQLGVTLLEAR